MESNNINIKIQSKIQELIDLGKMMAMMGARNTRGFSATIQTGRLPNPSHITYQGIFNEIKFPVGLQTQKIVDLHYGYARYQFASSSTDNKINDYLAIFLKSCKDGAERDDIPLNIVISLDVSGSMNGGLGQQRKTELSRLKLSIQAIKMLISKLKPNDSIGLTTFTTVGNVVFPPILKSKINQQQIFNSLDAIRAGGGTTVRSGFDISKSILLDFLKETQTPVSENRIIMITDVGDNSFQGEKQFIQKASIQQGVNLSVVGVSTDFRSEVCEKLKNVKGFNYFCAVNEGDIKKYIFQTFDFGFFPSASDLDISISAPGVKSLQVYGSPDSDDVAGYNNDFKEPQTTFTITKVKSVFPSEVEIVNGIIYTIGGLILVKLNRDNSDGSFKGEIKLKYTTQKGEKLEQNYQINYQFHPTEQFFTQQCLLKAVQGYTFASEMRSILKQSKNLKNQQIYCKFNPLLKDLKNIVPESKIKDYNNIVKIVQGYKQKKVKQQQDRKQDEQ